jgi:hypothetical protein
MIVKSVGGHVNCVSGGSEGLRPRCSLGTFIRLSHWDAVEHNYFIRHAKPRLDLEAGLLHS